MSSRAEKILEEALTLSVEERERIGLRLLESVHEDDLRDTVVRRAREIGRGEVEPADAEAAYERVRAKYRSR